MYLDVCKKVMMLISVSLIVAYSHLVTAEDGKMTKQEAEKIWDEYHSRINNRRLSEAKVINDSLFTKEGMPEIDLVLDFEFFTLDKKGAIGLKNQLSENYEMSLEKKDDYWSILGTTKPYAVGVTAEKHLDWVQFMHDVALSYRCIFSTWKVTNFENGQSWSNENIETEFN